MAIILCLETTTTNCSVAIAQDGKVIFLEEDMGQNYSHAERLHKYIAQVFEKAAIPMSALDAIAVSKGPGSYTGLRIGVSSAKGICYSLDKPLISVNTLLALAKQVKDSEASHIIPLIDARRMEVYSAVYDGNYNLCRETRADILDKDSYLQYLEKGKTVFIGNGVEKFKEVCVNNNAVFIQDALPSAREMAEVAERKYKISDIENVAYFEPYYLKDFLITKPGKKV